MTWRRPIRSLATLAPGQGDAVPAPGFFCQVYDALLLLPEVPVGGQKRGVPGYDLGHLMEFFAGINHIVQEFLIPALCMSLYQTSDLLLHQAASRQMTTERIWP